MKKLLVYLGLIILLFSFCGSVYAQTDSSFVFTTKPQIVKPNTLSKEITIQFQINSEPKNITETFDLDFKSTSGTGMFLGSTGNAPSKTMNKNTASRHFYYKDTTPGRFVIYVVAKGRVSKKVYQVSQDIFIGEENKTKVAPSKIIESKISEKKVTASLASVGSSTETFVNTAIVFEAPVRQNLLIRIISWFRRLFYSD